MRSLAQYEVVEAGVYGADRHWIRTHLLYALAYVLYHMRVEHGIAILELGSIVASIHLAA